MNGKEEFMDLLARIEATFKLREVTVGVFLVLVVSMRLFRPIIPVDPQQLNWIIFALITWLASAFVFRILTKKQKTAAGLSNLYLGYNVLFELFLLSLIVYFVGGMESIGAIFYCFIIVYTSVVFSKKRALIVSSAASIYYSLVVLLPYFDIVPFKHFLYPFFNLYQNLNYVIANFLFVIPSFYLIGLAANILTDLFRKRTEELSRTKTLLEDSRAILEIKVKARTEELKELAASLDEQVKERTKELQEKLEELKKFQKLTVGRELKMIELKKEIKELKKELEMKKNNLNFP